MSKCGVNPIGGEERDGATMTCNEDHCRCLRHGFGAVVREWDTTNGGIKDENDETISHGFGAEADASGML